MGHLLDALRDDRLYSLYFLALDTGLREGELVARRWADLDEGSRTRLVQTKFERETGLGIVEGPATAVVGAGLGTRRRGAPRPRRPPGRGEAARRIRVPGRRADLVLGRWRPLGSQLDQRSLPPAAQAPWLAEGDALP